MCVCVCVVVSPPPPGGLKVTCEYMAQQEGVLCEQVQLLSEANDDVCVTVKVHARVMGTSLGSLPSTAQKKIHNTIEIRSTF